MLACETVLAKYLLAGVTKIKKMKSWSILPWDFEVGDVQTCCDSKQGNPGGILLQGLSQLNQELQAVLTGQDTLHQDVSTPGCESEPPEKLTCTDSWPQTWTKIP